MTNLPLSHQPAQRAGRVLQSIDQKRLVGQYWSCWRCYRHAIDIKTLAVLPYYSVGNQLGHFVAQEAFQAELTKRDCACGRHTRRAAVQIDPQHEAIAAVTFAGLQAVRKRGDLHFCRHVTGDSPKRNLYFTSQLMCTSPDED